MTGIPEVALVTGASRGLGAVIARRLAADGCAVAVNYRAGAAAGQQVVESIRADGGTAEMYAADVTDETAVTDLVARVSEDLGPIHVLVANATGPQPPVALEDLSWQDHLDQLLFFVKSPTLLVDAALPAMKARGRGRVIQIGSDIFDRGLPGMSAYVAAKGAQIGLTKSWARELGPFGITVNLVALAGSRSSGTPAPIPRTWLAISPTFPSAGWARPRTSPVPCPSWLPRTRRSSPASASPSTAGTPSADLVPDRLPDA